MFNLVYKDILVQKKTLLIMFLYILFMIISFQNSASPILIPITFVASFMLTITACYYEDKNNTNIILNSLPVSKNIIVLVKYISGLIYSIIGVTMYCICITALKIFSIPIKLSPITIIEVLLSILLSTLLISFYYPIYFKFGYIKSQIVKILFILGPFFGLQYLSSYIKNNQEKQWLHNLINFLSTRTDFQISLYIVFITLFLVSVSYIISLKIYKNKEF